MTIEIFAYIAIFEILNIIALFVEARRLDKRIDSLRKSMFDYIRELKDGDKQIKEKVGER